MTTRAATADERGLHLHEPLRGLTEVLFDGTPVWSFLAPEPAAPSEEPAAPTFVPWPKNLTPYLDGVAEVALRNEGRTLELGELRFRSGEGRIRFVDRHGLPIVIDKWGIIQRPFAGRGSGTTATMLDYAERIVTVLQRDCGLEPWLAFGTLLGAVREGGVIAHDSDIDLAFLSDAESPAGVARDMFRAGRALTRAGLEVIHKTGSFLTVVFDAPDGAGASIDVYACFYVDDLVHETATVRAPLPREKFLPLGTLEFEGRPFPVPADPDAVLTLSYGPSWRVPDPSFRHEPGPEIVHRFDQWFGNTMVQRRAWEVFWRDLRDPATQHPSPFARWVLPRLPEHALVIDLGAGSGQDARLFAESGHRAVALDYARGSYRGLQAKQVKHLIADHLNLYDARDTVTRAAILVRRRGPRVVYSRGLLDALAPAGVENFWRFLGMVVRGGGSAYLEFAEEAAEGQGGLRFPVDPDEVVARLQGLGGTVVERHCEVVPPEQGRMRWRIGATWAPGHGKATDD
ncbi:LicD family protein [Nocardioides caldifontis]|uniref:LicD family protein n=1 Tax=Nocardioides caldifontis TaxID=2588938 RepID=UPI0011DF5E30|nr:LicD family protein [Nocardioides caldifontis]